MLNGLYYACSVIIVLMIIRWYIKYDGKPQTGGLFAMKAEPAPDEDGSAVGCEEERTPWSRD